MAHKACIHKPVSVHTLVKELRTPARAGLKAPRLARRLDVCGSATGDGFNKQSSDIDLLVEFDDMPFPDRGDAYWGLLIDAEALSGRHIDLVEVGAARHPYLREGIEASRQLLCAA